MGLSLQEVIHRPTPPRHTPSPNPMKEHLGRVCLYPIRLRVGAPLPKGPLAVLNISVGTVTQPTFVKQWALIVIEACYKQLYLAFASYVVYLSPDGGERREIKKASVLLAIRDDGSNSPVNICHITAMTVLFRVNILLFIMIIKPSSISRRK